jgi:mono/diheme cytochrome c family protein
MLKRIAVAVILVAAAAAGSVWLLTAPQPLAAAALPDRAADLDNGRRMFFAGGCGPCHAAERAQGEDRYLLGGGQALATPYGTFRAPNISPDPETGIGGWSDADFVNAMQRGVSPEGRHYYPSFPYTSYARMRTEDVLDLKAFLDTLPPVRNAVAGHDLAFPYNLRRGLGLWKRLHLSAEPVADLPEASEAVRRGQYLVEGPGHCGECHTMRDGSGGLMLGEWLAGAPSPDSDGFVPNITPHPDGLADWSERDIAYALETGFTPDFDTMGGSMTAVQENLAELPEADREAIAAYLKAIAALPNAYRPAAPPAAESFGY